MAETLTLNEKQLIVIKKVLFSKAQHLTQIILGKSATSEIHYAVEGIVLKLVDELDAVLRMNENLGTLRKSVSKTKKYAKPRKN